jgi:hypothetical protein
LLTLCSNPQPILVAFYDMHGLQWDYSFPRSPHGECKVSEKGYFFFFATASRLALGPTQPLTHRVLGALSLGFKWPGCEPYHSHPSSAEVKNAWSYISTPPTGLSGVVLNQTQDRSS